MSQITSLRPVIKSEEFRFNLVLNLLISRLNPFTTHVDPEVTPTAQKPSRVPFPRREIVTAKVEDLIRVYLNG